MRARTAPGSIGVRAIEPSDRGSLDHVRAPQLTSHRPIPHAPRPTLTSGEPDSGRRSDMVTHRRIRQPSCTVLIDQPRQILCAVCRCFFGASRSDRSIASIAVLNGSSRGAIRRGVFRGGRTADSNGADPPSADAHRACQPVRGSITRPPDDRGGSSRTVPQLTSASSPFTFVITDPDHPDQ